MLGISPKTLYNRLEEYAAAGYVLPGEDGPGDARDAG
jgi:hypothetical protein